MPRDAGISQNRMRDLARVRSSANENAECRFGVIRSPIRNNNTHATRARLPQPQPSGTHFRLTPAITPAYPQPVACIPVGSQLPEHLAALQRRRPRAGPPHATLLAAAAIPRFTALHRVQSSRHVGAAPARPKPHVGAKVLARDEISERATGNVAIRRKGPFWRQGGRDRLFHVR
jgi:hypothetical protein